MYTHTYMSRMHTHTHTYSTHIYPYIPFFILKCQTHTPNTATHTCTQGDTYIRTYTRNQSHANTLLPHILTVIHTPRERIAFMYVSQGTQRRRRVSLASLPGPKIAPKGSPEKPSQWRRNARSTHVRRRPRFSPRGPRPWGCFAAKPTSTRTHASRVA